MSIRHTLAANGWPASLARPRSLLPREREPVTAQRKPAFGFCLNTSTVRDKERQVAADHRTHRHRREGRLRRHRAVDLGTRRVRQGRRAAQGPSQAHRRRRAEGRRTRSASPSGSSRTTARRKKGLEQAKRDMDWAAQIGGPRIAAPPVGATGGMSKRDDPKFTQPVIDLLAAADRYRALLELGKSMGVTPIVEVWGFSKTLRRLGEALLRRGRVRRRARRCDPAGRLPPLQGRLGLRRAAAARAATPSASSTSTTTRRSTATRSPTPTASTPATASPR